MAQTEPGVVLRFEGREKRCETRSRPEAGCGMVLPFRSRDQIRSDIVAALLRCLAEWDREEAFGPHVVLARGSDSRCFGPFATRALAEATAAAEAAEWDREFSEIDVSFEVVPLLDAHLMAPVRDT